ncbi:hypothetical protein [Saccharopolyspora shandongensis]|uniref:hypothetical protein n=1 Tax=Saccharopolyspora shandongensis TaxID=418495 RepID=UPI0033C7518E
MTDHDEPKDGPEKYQDQPSEEPKGLVARLKQLYEDRPAVFAVGVISVSALMFLLGGVLSGDVDLVGVFSTPTGRSGP